MSGWTAVIPVRLGGPRKSRLADCLSPAERERLADQLFEHVVAVVQSRAEVGEVIILSPARPAAGRWWPDAGRGLNVELTALRTALPERDLLVVHADLPFLAGADVAAMIAAAEDAGIAIAPDHLGQGTNAVALRSGRPFTFAFGSGSLAAHRATGVTARLVETPGLARDVDEPADLDSARVRGFVFDPLPAGAEAQQ